MAAGDGTAFTSAATADTPERAVSFDLFDEDRLPIPDERAKERNPIDQTYTGTYAEPRGQLRVRLDYNDVDERWQFTVAIADRGTIVPRQPAMLFHPYQFRERELFMFVDPFGRYERVTPSNLGDPVFLVVIPGPESPGFIEWYRERTTIETDAPDEPDDPLDRLLF